MRLTEQQKDLVLDRLLSMRRAGQLAAVWPPTIFGVPIWRVECPCGEPEMLPWKEAAEVTGVCKAPGPRVMKSAKTLRAPRKSA